MIGSGVINNIDVNRHIEKVLGLDLAAVRNTLYLPASLFEARGGKVSIDRTDAANPVVRVTRGRDLIELPVNKNGAVLNGRRIWLNGLVTLIDGRAWVPKQAIDLLR
jgi:alkaline phosphatase